MEHRRFDSRFWIGFCLAMACLTGVLTAPLPVHAHEDDPGLPPEDVPAASHVACTEGFALDHPCLNIELEAFLPLARFGAQSANDIWGWTDPVTGIEYALLGLREGTAFVELSDPHDPQVVGFLPTHTTPSLWRDIKVYDGFAFIVSEAANHGMQAFDLTRLRDVVDPPVEFTSDSHYAGFTSAHNIVINEETGFAYAVGTRTCRDGLHVIDIQDPLAPEFAACFGDRTYTHDSQCVVYRGPDVDYRDHEVCFSSNATFVVIHDVTDKTQLQIISRTSYLGRGYAHQGWLSEDQRYFLLDDELDEIRSGHPSKTYIWDVSDLDAPFLSGVHLAESPAIDHNLYIRGNHVYQANYRSGVRILRLGDLSKGELGEVAFFDSVPEDDEPEFSGVWSVYPYFESGLVIASDIYQGLFVLRPDLAAISECSDGIDNDADGLRDFGEDPSCIAPSSSSESARVEFAVCELKIRHGSAESFQFAALNTDESLPTLWESLFGIAPATTPNGRVTLQADQTVTWPAGTLTLGGAMRVKLETDPRTGTQKLSIERAEAKDGVTTFESGTGGVNPNLADAGWHRVRIKGIEGVTVTLDGVRMSGFLRELKARLDKDSTTDTPLIKNFKLEMNGISTTREDAKGIATSLTIEVPATIVTALAETEFYEQRKDKPNPLLGHTEADYERDKHDVIDRVDLSPLRDGVNNRLRVREGACAISPAP